MMENEPVVERWQAIYRGRVQGVGFRQTVQRLARRYFVTGYVRNLDDGTVELVTECPAAIFTNIDTQIRQLFGRNISDASIRSDTATDEFSRFEIHE